MQGAFDIVLDDGVIKIQFDFFRTSRTKSFKSAKASTIINTYLHEKGVACL